MQHFDITLTVLRRGPGQKDFVARGIVITETVEKAKGAIKDRLHECVNDFFNHTKIDLNQYEHRFEVTQTQGTSIIKFGWELE